MRLVSLNTWAGREFESLRDYILEQSLNTDIFCFQEIFDNSSGRAEIGYVSSDQKRIEGGTYRSNLFSELEKLLPDHKGYFAPTQNDFGFDPGVDFPLSWGVAMFVRKSLEVKDTGDVMIYRERNTGTESGTIPRNLQYGIIESGGDRYVIAHFHGLWNGGGKIDTSDRIEQSKKVRKVLDELEGKKILCGDFNLLPDTNSLEILERGMKNLIKTHGINSTRSLLYTKSENKFADYTLISPDVNVKCFEVPYVEASDHLPMVLHFD